MALIGKSDCVFTKEGKQETEDVGPPVKALM